jgi:hypothetical protein
MMAARYGFSVALGLELLIGLERERSKGDGPTRRPAGIRTFGLACLLDAVAMQQGGTMLLAFLVRGATAPAVPEKAPGRALNPPRPSAWPR